ncbi:Glucose/arabinose dehydrogenase, beta-propeller fold [Sphingomonas gellani]|uniref:Glucose/arabinose dehydrogenase, beta-propeller fold n=1 Tax=Sphingomonas gellani TaxID=1166340 RepID=A0A1H8B682_9SPHN|nr:sorbosone dehydrogenase family protein [Sphingomonas gellani]SEM77548.1 Glucose/arabinose dehydrogenase, beta-propeller fold [Sphingomonas gellani]
MSRALATWSGLALTIALAACSGAGGDASSQLGPNPHLPEQNQFLVPPMHIARPAPWGNATPTVPAGLKVEAFATGMKNVRELFVLPNGDVLAVEPKGPQEPVSRPKDILVNWIQGFGHSKVKGADQITLLRDADGDGRAETRSVFLDHLVSPFGVALVGSDLYVANTDAIVHFPYQTGQTRVTAPGTILTDLPGGPINHHWTKSLTAGPDGSKLYVGIGSNSNITENGMEAEKDRARIWEVDRATGAHRNYATGLRNPNGLTFEPATKRLWTVVNERDELGPDLVPDYLTSVTPGAFYGWPYSYWGKHVDPRVKPERPDMVSRAVMPDYSLSSHVAPLSLAFYQGASMPQFRGGAFIGEHGSWDRGHFNGYKVVWVPFQNGRPSGKAVDVVTGFLDGENHARGRPVGVAVDRSGALLIADDLANVIWRVSPR